MSDHKVELTEEQLAEKEEHVDDSDDEDDLKEPTANEKFLASTGIVSLPMFTFDHSGLEYASIRESDNEWYISIKLKCNSFIIDTPNFKSQTEAEQSLKSLTRQVALCRHLAK
jgi:hypothetical protein